MLAQQDHARLADVYGFRGGGTAELHEVRFSDITPDVEGARATVVALLSAHGRVVYRDHETKLDYVGRERFHMKACAAAMWCEEGDQLAGLRGILVALFQRYDAWERRDPEAYGRLVSADYRDGGEDRTAALQRVRATLSGATATARVVGWQIRVDRASAEVGEDLEVPPQVGGAAAGRERHVYRLVREEGRWVFAGGV